MLHDTENTFCIFFVISTAPGSAEVQNQTPVWGLPFFIFALILPVNSKVVL